VCALVHPQKLFSAKLRDELVSTSGFETGGNIPFYLDSFLSSCLEEDDIGLLTVSTHHSLNLMKTHHHHLDSKVILTKTQLASALTFISYFWHRKLKLKDKQLL
jgi:hypothetical protein